MSCYYQAGIILHLNRPRVHYSVGFSDSLSMTMTLEWARWRLKSPTSRLFTHLFILTQINEISKLRVTGHCAGNSPVTGEFDAQMASNAATVSIWWRHHGMKRGVLKAQTLNIRIWDVNLSIPFWKYIGTFSTPFWRNDGLSHCQWKYISWKWNP